MTLLVKLCPSLNLLDSPLSQPSPQNQIYSLWSVHLLQHGSGSPHKSDTLVCFICWLTHQSLCPQTYNSLYPYEFCWLT